MVAFTFSEAAQEEALIICALYGNFEESTIAKSVPWAHSDDGYFRHDDND